ncbi:MAG: hypothetical protein RLZZ628_881 [Bacteroidota bacterium]|jgi:hypothetical protein
MSVKHFKYMTISVISILLFHHCGPSKRDIRNFYFPLAALQQPFIYEYRSKNNDSLPPFYCQMQTTQQGDSLFLTTTTYGAAFETLQFDRELQTPYGMLLKELFQYVPDKTGKRIQNPTKIHSGNAFPYQITDSKGIFVYNISWKSAVDTTQYNIIRNRRFGGDTTWTFQGKTYPAIWFHLREVRERDNNGRTSVEFQGKEVFAKEIGLVYVRRAAAGYLIEYELKDKRIFLAASN